MKPELRLLSPVSAGQSLFEVVTDARINAIQALIKALWSGENLRAGGNVQVVPSANGPTINVLAGGGGTGTAQMHAFQLYKATNGSLRVNRGTVGNVIPSNIDAEWSFSNGSVTLHVALSDEFVGVPTSATISRGGPAAETKTASSIIIGEIYNGKIYQYVSGSLAFSQIRYDSIDEPEAEPLFGNCFGRL